MSKPTLGAHTVLGSIFCLLICMYIDHKWLIKWPVRISTQSCGKCIKSSGWNNHPGQFKELDLIKGKKQFLLSIVEGICNFYEKFTCLTLCFFLIFLISSHSKQALTKKLLLLNKGSGHLIGHLWYMTYSVCINPSVNI